MSSAARMVLAWLSPVLLSLTALVPVWDLPPLCGMRRLLGLPCPFCGTTRAIHAVTHGDLLRAFSLNPLGAFLALVGLALFAGEVLRLVRTRGITEPPPIPLRARHGVAAAALVLANWAYVLSAGAL